MDAGYLWKIYSVSIFCPFLALFPSKTAFFTLALAHPLVNPCMPTSGNTPTMANAPLQSNWLIHPDSRNRDIVLIFIPQHCDPL